MQGSQKNKTELKDFDEYAKEGPRERTVPAPRAKYRGESISQMMERLSLARKIALAYDARPSQEAGEDKP